MAEEQRIEHAGGATGAHPPSGGREKAKSDLTSNILAIVGLIILVVIIIWGLLHLATLTGPWLSSLLSRTTALAVSAPASATSGTPFAIGWKHSASEKGTYAFLYPCRSGLQFDMKGPGENFNPVPCGAALGAPAADNSFIVKPTLAATSSTDVLLTIIFIPSATTSKQVQGSATVKINPPAAPAPQVSATTAAKPSPAPAPRVSGPADLSVAMVSASADQSGNATVVFDIGNAGGSASGAYAFTVQLPTANGSPYAQGYGAPYTYASPQQAPLGAGDHIVNTLRFSGARSGTVSVSLSIADANSGNNYASQALNIPYTNYNYYGYDYYSQYYNPPYPQAPYFSNQQPYANQPYYQYQYNQPYQYQRLYPYYSY